MPYDELVKRLRHSANIAERGLITPPSELCAAANAIEELTALSRRQEVELVELTGELASKPRWIPVTERLPKCGERVLVFGGVTMYVAYYDKNRYGGESWHKLNSKSHYCNPTHWMPLPEPPKEGEEWNTTTTKTAR